MKDAEIEAEIDDFLEAFNQTTYRGMRVNAVRVGTWLSQYGWSGLYPEPRRCFFPRGLYRHGPRTTASTSRLS
jgi:hypothetical protein